MRWEAPATISQCFVGGGDLHTPNFNRDDSNRKLNLNRLAGDWNDDNVFVAFRDLLI